MFETDNIMKLIKQFSWRLVHGDCPKLLVRVWAMLYF